MTITLTREEAQQVLDALEQAGNSLGSFCSDMGWAQKDMDNMDNCDAMAETLRARLSAPKQEPVAWVLPDFWNHLKTFNCGTAYRMKGDDRQPLYTAPPQRQPLTDEQVRDLWSWSATAEAERTANTQQHAFARAIERAHVIGENK
jgi:hypothetical protein